MHHDVSDGVSIKVIPSLGMEMRPGFRCCGIANRDGLAHCPKCGAPALASTFHQADQVVMTWPLAARVLIAFGEWLLNLANKIERWHQ